MAGRIQHHEDFRPFCLGEHGKPSTRALHCLGSAIALVLLGAGVVTTDWRLLAGAPAIGYGIVWVSHASIERNWPATFRYPLFSLVSDLRICALALTGRLGASSRNTGSTGPESRGKIAGRRARAPTSHTRPARGL